jgi:hypothetical protein
MMTFESVGDALNSLDPWGNLDRLVRAELDSGRVKKLIYNELIAMDQAIRAIPGLTEDAEESLMDILDRLSGFCPRRKEYQNPAVLPSEEEIAALPRWARIAFAARCARRVWPLVLSSWTAAPTHHLSTGKRAIIRAEQIANGADFYAQDGNILGTTDGASRAAFETITSDGLANDVVTIGLKTAGDAVYAASQSGSADTVANAVSNSELTITTFLMEQSSWNQTFSSTGSGVIRRDFDHLADLALWQKWTDDTPVPPEVFGPLWPEGAPAGWPADPEVPQHSSITLELTQQDDIPEKVLLNETMNIFNALNEYHISRGGQTLCLEDFQPMISSRVLSGV